MKKLALMYCVLWYKLRIKIVHKRLDPLTARYRYWHVMATQAAKSDPVLSGIFQRKANKAHDRLLRVQEALVWAKWNIAELEERIWGQRG